MKVRALVVAAALTGLSAHACVAGTLNQPMGMAVDNKGNLYVANFGGGNNTTQAGYVRIYDSNYNPVKSLATGNNPTTVALNSSGDIYVGDAATFTVKRYSPFNNYEEIQVINTQRYPAAIAVDGLDNVWIVNRETKLVNGSEVPYSTIGMYDGDGTLLNTGYPPSVTNAIAARGAFVALGEDRGLESLRALEVLTNNVQHGYRGINSAITAVSMDNHGVEYVGTQDHELYRCWPGSGWCRFMRTVDYEPSGIAVDAEHGKFYVSSKLRSTVDVFQTDLNATFVTTFH